MVAPMRAALALLLLCASASAAAQQAYWICRDEAGRKQIQDKACAEAPNAPPTGVAHGVMSVPALKSAAPDPREGREATSESDTGAWWSHQFARGRAALESAIAPGGLLRHPWLHIGVGLLALLWIGVWAGRRLRDRLRTRRLEQAASAQPDPYRRALRDIVVTPAASAPRAQAMSLEPAVPTHWSAAVLRALDPAAFTLLARRLWQVRGLRVDDASDQPLLLRHPANPQQLHGVALCRGGGTQGVAAVRELFGLMQHHGCEYGAVMSSGEFDVEARDFVRGKHIELKGWSTLMTEIEALSDEQRASLLAEVVRKPVSA